MMWVLLTATGSHDYSTRVHGYPVAVTREEPLWTARLQTGGQPVIARAGRLGPLTDALGRLSPDELRRILACDLTTPGPPRQ